MEINRKTFMTVLSQIKAHKDVIILQDSSTEGCLDILYSPKGDEVPRCVNKMTIRLGGLDEDLFDNTPVEKLGKPVLVILSSVKGALRKAHSCVLKDGYINGVCIEVDETDARHSMFSDLFKIYKNYSRIINRSTDFESVSLLKNDYAYMVSECAKFVAKDPKRYFMNGICFDFVNGGKDVIHIAATDGIKLCLLKHAASHKEYTEEKLSLGQFIVPLVYMHVPDSSYNSVKIRLTEQYGQILISTEDYHFEGLFACIDGQFPNYPKVIPAITEKTQWFTLYAASLRMTIDLVKGLLDSDLAICLDAENPESLSLIASEGQPAMKIGGTASRPLRVAVGWDHLSACLFDGPSLTKFWLDGSNKAVSTHETKAAKGLTLDVTKVFMPRQPKINDGDDEFGIPKDRVKDEPLASSFPSSVTEQEQEPETDKDGDESL